MSVLEPSGGTGNLIKVIPPDADVVVYEISSMLCDILRGKFEDASVFCEDFLEIPPDPKGYSLVWKLDMLEWLSTTDRKEIHEYLMKFLLKLLLDITIDPLDDIEQELDRVHEEGAFSRAIGMSPTSITLTDIIGEERYELRFWY